MPRPDGVPCPGSANPSLSYQWAPRALLSPVSSASLFLSFDHPEHPVQWSQGLLSSESSLCSLFNRK